jgi:L-seryl-tRNA(Ser) seleniumtransferase
VLLALQELALTYLDRTVVESVPFWQMATTSVNELTVRAHQLVTEAAYGEVVATEATPGAGSAPNAGIASVGIRIAGDHLAALRRAQPPIVARSRDGATILDLRTVNPTDDHHLVEALRACAS